MKISTCVECGKDFTNTNGLRKYCTETCRRKQSMKRSRELNPTDELPSGKTGAVSELLVCAHLLRLGFDVFRAVSQSAPCDIIATKGNDVRRIEVRTGWRKRDGTLKAYIDDGQKHKYDHMCVVSTDGTEIFFVPPL
jgi:hypothetical protein